MGFVYTILNIPASRTTEDYNMKRKSSAAILVTLILYLLLSVVTAHAFKLPDTGQTKCYNSAGTETTCLDAGQDGSYLVNRMSFTDNGNGTVTDNITGLMWQQQDDGATHNWYQATGTFDGDYNSDTKNVCAELTTGGYSDWRLPTKKELITIVDYSKTYPTPSIDAVFLQTQTQPYWTSTEHSQYSAAGWQISFYNGDAAAQWKHVSTSMYIRCVRGDQTSQSLSDSGNNTVTDSRTGLMWQQTESGAFTYAAALDHCNTSTHATYSDWRLPNIKELESLTTDTATEQINKTLFPAAVAAPYWSSTSVTATATDSWVIRFNDMGYFGYENDKDDSYNVRCVRGGGVVACPDEGATVSGSGVFRASLQEAYTAADTGQTVLAQTMPFSEDLALADPIVITLMGGYDCGFVSNPGFTTLNGKLTISGGTVTVANFIIK
jgi:hypothetical protein